MSLGLEDLKAPIKQIGLPRSPVVNFKKALEIRCGAFVSFNWLATAKKRTKNPRNLSSEWQAECESHCQCCWILWDH